jgi:hypothetical protein
MPASVIKVRKKGITPYVAVSSSDQELTIGASNFYIDYKATPRYSYEVGTYAATLQYTLTDQ